MKDDGLQHIFLYATFVWTPRWKSWKRKMTAYPILISMQSFIQFQMMVPQIQMKRAKRFILTFIHTYFHTDQPSHRVSYKLTKNIILRWIKLIIEELSLRKKSGRLDYESRERLLRTQSWWGFLTETNFIISRNKKFEERTG